MKHKQTICFFLFLTLLIAAATAVGIQTIPAGARLGSNLQTTPLSSPLEQCIIAWADALQERDGEARFDIMSQQLQQEFIALQTANGFIWNDTKQDFQETINSNGDYVWFLGVSSPWVESYEYQYNPHNGTIILTYHMTTSEPHEYILQEVLTCIEENGSWKVDNYKETVSYLPKEAYHQALKLQTSVDEGHQLWRLDPEEVALTFLHEHLKITNIELLIPWNADTSSIIYRTSDGEEITIMLYHPILRENAFWSVYAYQFLQTNYDVHDRLVP